MHALDGTQDESRLNLNLNINEIFYSLQGESSTVGLPTIFIRLTGCPLRCNYCDTEYAFHVGKRFSISDVIDEITQYQCDRITVTGGEPLAQGHCLSLLHELCDRSYKVSLETSGAIDISKVDQRVMTVMDIKTPASGEEKKNRYENLHLLKSNDEAKFVICSRDDYDWSKAFIAEHKLSEKCHVLFSPSNGELDARQLADWIIEDQLSVRFQIQLHKELWGDISGK